MSEPIESTPVVLDIAIILPRDEGAAGATVPMLGQS